MSYRRYKSYEKSFKIQKIVDVLLLAYFYILQYMFIFVSISYISYNSYNSFIIMENKFIPLKGNYRKLIAFQKAECIYDITYFFAHNFFEKGDRTIDQMIQAARSGKQNIVEGSTAATTSKETHIKLINVAKASFHELLMDYEDYLRVRGLKLWDANTDKYIQARRVCKNHNDSAYYRNAITTRSDETIANIAIVLLHQVDFLLYRLLETAKQQFVEDGGIREEMTKARINYRNNNH